MPGLADRARAAEHCFRNGQASDDVAGLELFRRAIDEGDQAAWHAVLDVYRPLLVARAGQRLIRGLVVEDDGFCVDRAFQRFWAATRRGRCQHFKDLPAVFRYLHLCLGSVLLDEARARRRKAAVSLDDVPPEACLSADPAAQVIGRIARRELWRAIDRELGDADQRLVARLSFVAGLTPREILARHPDKFQDAFAVYRVKRALLDRLRRSPVILHLID